MVLTKEEQFPEIKWMERESSTSRKMEWLILDSGKMTYHMESENKSMKMVPNMKGNSSKGKNIAQKEFLNGQMERNMSDLSKMAWWKDKVL